MKRVLLLLVSLGLGLESATSAGVGAGSVIFVDGATIKCDVLFEHPNAHRLVVRSAANRTLQSFDLNVIRKVEVGGEVTRYNEPRALTKTEVRHRKRNTLWADRIDDNRLGRYAKESWRRKPLIVWRFPGRSGDAMKAENWLDDAGRPLEELPWDATGAGGEKTPEYLEGEFDGDILLPGAEQEYAAIQPGNRDHLGAYRIRHLTVEKNASYQIRYTVTGNLWMKDGARIGDGTQTGGLGSGSRNKHTFARFCNYYDSPGPTWANAPVISHWVWIDTGERGSLEIIGQSGGPGDRLTLKRGTLILSTDSSIGNGGRGSFYTTEGTTTVMLNGAKAGAPQPVVTKNRATYGIAGTLMFGHPDKPLTRDLIFSGCYYPYEEISPFAAPSQRTSGASFVLGKTGRMVVHSADPKKARVIFRPRSRELPGARVQRWNRDRLDDRDVPQPSLWERDDVPKGIAAVFRGRTEFNGVVFDGFYKGGIVIDPKAVKDWKHVSYGPNNHGEPKELIAVPPAMEEQQSQELVTIEPAGAYRSKGESVTVELIAKGADLPIRYTLDGSIPDRNDPLYSQEIELTETTTVMAALFKEGFIYGLAASADFVFDKPFNIAYHASASATDSFGGMTGKYVNDLKPATYWRGGTQKTQVVTLKWDEAVTFNRIRIAATRVQSWRLQVQSGRDWRNIVAGNGEFPIEKRFSPVTSSHARLVFVKNDDRPIVHDVVLTNTESRTDRAEPDSQR